MKLIPNLLSITIIIFNILLLNPPQVKAEITTNNDWTVQIDNVDITSDSPIKNKTKQPPQNIDQGTYTGTNYKIQTGFEPTNLLGYFSFSISNSLIDYGLISPTNPIYRTSNLIISSDALKNFMEVQYQNHPLSTTDTNTQIPDSTCDNGSCSEMTSAPWNNTLTYGFGYRCENTNGINCPTDMTETEYYRQISDSSKNETPEAIMANVQDKNRKNEVQLTYKINTSKNQSPGNYSNTITYIATPGY
jgi:hypothetical protein